MASHRVLDVKKIRADLQAQLAANEKLPTASTAEDDTESCEREKRISVVIERNRFIERTLEDTFRNEGKLRGVRAAMTVVE